MELISLLLKPLNNRALSLFAALIILLIPVAAIAQNTTASARSPSAISILKVGAIHHSS